VEFRVKALKASFATQRRSAGVICMGIVGDCGAWRRRARRLVVYRSAVLGSVGPQRGDAFAEAITRIRAPGDPLMRHNPVAPILPSVLRPLQAAGRILLAIHRTSRGAWTRAAWALNRFAGPARAIFANAQGRERRVRCKRLTP